MLNNSAQNLKNKTKPQKNIKFCVFFTFALLFLQFFIGFIAVCDNKVSSCYAINYGQLTSEDCGLNVNFDINGQSDKLNLIIRENAKKYIMTNNRLDKTKLSNFLASARERLIEERYLLSFCFFNFDSEVERIIACYEQDPISAQANVIPNSGKLEIKSAKVGTKIDKNNVILSIFNNLVNNKDKFNIKTESVKPLIDDGSIAQVTKLRGHFYTSYAASSDDRKFNIKKALAQFDGLVLGPGEVLSFNEITGRRTEENGYKGAKIIVNGDFVDGMGGGVCQASTTLYNACLKANVEVIEAHPHSLQVSYIAPSFDAMVNYGSSDLKLKNSTNFPLIFATCCTENRCEVFIYGENNDYKIERRSEVIEEIEPGDAVYLPYEEGMLIYGENVIKYPKPGLVSVAYLDFYKDGELVLTKKLRTDRYKPVEGKYAVFTSADIENEALSAIEG